MSLQQVLSPLQFARFCAFLGLPPTDTASALSGPPYGLGPDHAFDLAHMAFAERDELNQIESDQLDLRSFQAEFELEAVTLDEITTQQPDHDEDAVRDALVAAVALHRTHDYGVDELSALAHGAFLLDPVSACHVAALAVRLSPCRIT